MGVVDRLWMADGSLYDPKTGTSTHPMKEQTMTRVTNHTETVTRHIWTIPADWRDHSAPIGEFQDAYAMASNKAEDLGIRTNSDDWVKVQSYDDAIRLWFETEKEDPKEVPDRMGRFLNWVSTHESPDVQQKISQLFVEWSSTEVERQNRNVAGG